MNNLVLGIVIFFIAVGIVSYAIEYIVMHTHVGDIEVGKR